MMSASSLDASRLVAPSRVLYPGSVNTACLRRSGHARQRRVIYTRPSAVDGPALRIFSSSSTRRTSPCWLPCSGPPMRRRGAIARAAGSPSVTAAFDSEVVAHVGPFRLTRQDCIWYIVPAAALRILASCMDGKGMLLLAQLIGIVMAAIGVAEAYKRTFRATFKHVDEMNNPGVITAVMLLTGMPYLLLVIGCWKRFIVPITVSYPFYTGILPVLAPAALYIKQHPAFAAGCYSVAKAIPYALCIAAAVAIVRRAAARKLPASAVPSKAADPSAGNGGPGLAGDTSMPDAITVLQAETSCIWTRLDGIAKRLGAVEDYSGDDEAQNMPLRRVAEVEDKLAQVARLLASEIEELKEAVATRKEEASYGALSDLRDWDAKFSAAAQQMQQLQEGLHAANSKHAQLLQEMAGKADATAAAKQEARITESMQQISAVRQQMLEHSRLHSALQDFEDDVNSEAERIDAAQDSVKKLEEELQEHVDEEYLQDRQTESRLDKAEEQIAALQRTGEEAAAAAAAAASIGNTLQARLFQAEDRIKGLACLVEEGLSKGEGDIAELKGRLDGCAAGEDGPDKYTMERRLHASEEEIEALKQHVGGYLINMNEEDCLENRMCRAEALLDDLRETAKGAQRGVTLKQRDAENVMARLDEAEKEIASLKELDAEDLLERLDAAEEEIAALKQTDVEDMLGRIEEAEDAIAEFKQMDADAVMARLDEAEEEIAALKQTDVDEVVARLDEAEDEIASLKQLDAEDVLARLDEAEKEITFLKQVDAVAVMERLDEAEEEIAAVRQMDAVAVMARLDDAENEIADLMLLDEANVVARLDVAEKEIGALNNDAELLDEADVVGRLEEAEDKIRKLTKTVSGVKDALQPVLEGDYIPETAQWKYRGIPMAEWKTLWAKECKERAEAASNDSSLEQKLQGIQSSLHSELKGDYWGLDIKGFKAQDAAVDSKADAQVKAPAKDVPKGSELQLVKPRPAPEPEQATATEPEQAPEEEEARNARDRDGVTSEKIQALKRTLDTRAPFEALPATSKTVTITWEDGEAFANPKSTPSMGTDGSVAPGATAQDDLSESAAAGEAAADDMAAAVAAEIAADVAADVSDAREAADLAAADAATAAAAAAARAGAVAAAAVTNAQSAADTAAADAAAAAAASMAAAAAINADVAAAADVSGARTAAELAAAFSQELAAQWAPEIEFATTVAAAPAGKDQPLRSSKQAATPGEREVSIMMVDDIPTQPTKAQVEASGLSEERKESSQPKAAAANDDNVSDEDSFELDVETDELWNLMVDAIEASEKPQRKAAAIADDSGDVSDEDSFDLDVELWDSMLGSIEDIDDNAQRKADTAADDSDDEDDDKSDDDIDEDSFDLDVFAE